MTDPQSPSSSGPPTPSIAAAAHAPRPGSPVVQNQISLNAASNNHHHHPPPAHTQPHHPIPPQGYQGSPAAPLPSTIAPSVPASALPGARLSGRLVGVVSLTDVLFLYARASGLSPTDPAETRNRRRRSSSSSLSVQRSGDIGRELLRG